MALFPKMLQTIDFDSVVTKLDLPQPGSNRWYSHQQLVISFLASVWCGANCFEHLEVNRSDQVIREIFGWNSMAVIRHSNVFLKSLIKPPTSGCFRNFTAGFYQSPV